MHVGWWHHGARAFSLLAPYSTCLGVGGEFRWPALPGRVALIPGPVYPHGDQRRGLSCL